MLSPRSLLFLLYDNEIGRDLAAQWWPLEAAPPVRSIREKTASACCDWRSSSPRATHSLAAVSSRCGYGAESCPFESSAAPTAAARPRGRIRQCEILASETGARRNLGMFRDPKRDRDSHTWSRALRKWVTARWPPKARRRSRSHRCASSEPTRPGCNRGGREEGNVRYERRGSHLALMALVLTIINGWIGFDVNFNRLSADGPLHSGLTDAAAYAVAAPRGEIASSSLSA